MNNPKFSGRNQPSIELHIEELVLHGFAAVNRHLVGNAVEQELARLFTEQGISPEARVGSELKAIDAGEFRVASGASAERIGAQIAQSVYGGLAVRPRPNADEGGVR
jgi:hypothetical protein